METSLNSTSITGKRTIISLRIKLLVVFTLLFGAIFSVIFIWFYQFASTRAIERLAEDLNVIIDAAHSRVNGADLQRLVVEGARGPDGNANHPVYADHAAIFTQLKDFDPRGSAYTMIRKDGEYWVVTAAEAFTDPENTADFMAPIGLTTADVPADFDALFDGERDSWFLLEPYEDPFGAWISGYRTVRDPSGAAIGVVGADFHAEYYYDVREKVRQAALPAFGLAYLVVFITVYGASSLMARPIRKLETLAARVGEGDYEVDFGDFARSRLPDEITSLASVFSIMKDKVYERETRLKQRVAELEIVIEEKKLNEQVSEITDSEFFMELSQKAIEMRTNRTRQRYAGTFRTAESSTEA